MIGDRFTAPLLFLYAITGFFVLIEPAPTDLIFMGLLLLLPLYRKAYLNKEIFIYVLVISFITLLYFYFVDRKRIALSFGALNIYMLFIVLLISSYIRKSKRNLEYLWKGYVYSAAVSVILVILIQLGFLPWKKIIYYGNFRLQGFFKDPNVFGPYLVPPVVYLIGRSLKSEKLKIHILLAGILLILIFQAGSRAAWLNLFVAFIVFFFLTEVKYYKKIYYLIPIVVIVFLLFQTGIFSFGNIIEHRTKIENYDYKRFSNWYRAINAFLANPLGVGPGVSISKLGMATHNLYLIILTDYGLIGFIIWGVFLIHTLATYDASIFSGQIELIYITAYASIIGILANSFFIDTTHWRHFYLLLGIVWGMRQKKA